jgi:hypothetical protein
MFATYTYTSTATAGNVLNDIVSILTGTTDKATLSASCDQANTTITSTYAAGWTLHDASAGTNAKCIKAPLADDPTKYKYVVIDTNGSTYVLSKVYETWDETGHTGTNLADGSATSSANQQLALTAGGTLYIGATARYCCFTAQTTTSFGSSTGNNSLTGCFERTRMGVWDTVAKGVPPFIFNRSTGRSLNVESAPRLFKYDNTSVTTTSAVCNMVSIGMIQTRPATYKIIDDTGASVMPMWPLYVSNTALMNCPYGNISALCDIWMLPDSSCAHLDTVTVGAKDYIVIKGTSTGASRYAILAE